MDNKLIVSNVFHRNMEMENWLKSRGFITNIYQYEDDFCYDIILPEGFLSAQEALRIAEKLLWETELAGKDSKD